MSEPATREDYDKLLARIEELFEGMSATVKACDAGVKMVSEEVRVLGQQVDANSKITMTTHRGMVQLSADIAHLRNSVGSQIVTEVEKSFDAVLPITKLPVRSASER